jgi:hypothetical protein
MEEYLTKIDTNNGGVDFWYESIIQMIGIEFEEKMQIATEIFQWKVETNDYSDFTDYYNALSDMIESYSASRAIMKFQECFIKKAISTTMKSPSEDSVQDKANELTTMKKVIAHQGVPEEDNNKGDKHE